MWMDSSTGNRNANMNNQNMYDNLAFCLSRSPGGGQPVPLAPWTLILTIILIGGAIVFRYYRMV
jgi:hypothetical protein